MKDIRQILAVNRLEEFTPDLLRSGVDLARRFSAALTLLRITAEPRRMAVSAPGSFMKGEHQVPTVSERQRQELERTVRTWSSTSGVPIESMVSEEDPAEAILHTVSQRSIDLIMLLAHEEWRVEHILFGGDYDELIRKLPCSIMLVKHEPHGAG